jgi:hypothetical protein
MLCRPADIGRKPIVSCVQRFPRGLASREDWAVEVEDHSLQSLLRGPVRPISGLAIRFIQPFENRYHGGSYLAYRDGNRAQSESVGRGPNDCANRILVQDGSMTPSPSASPRPPGR